jgi:hypothetical protein
LALSCPLSTHGRGITRRRVELSFPCNRIRNTLPKEERKQLIQRVNKQTQATPTKGRNRFRVISFILLFLTHSFSLLYLSHTPKPVVAVVDINNKQQTQAVSAAAAAACCTSRIDFFSIDMQKIKGVVKEGR